MLLNMEGKSRLLRGSGGGSYLIQGLETNSWLGQLGRGAGVQQQLQCRSLFPRPPRFLKSHMCPRTNKRGHLSNIDHLQPIYKQRGLYSSPEGMGSCQNLSLDSFFLS